MEVKQLKHKAINGVIWTSIQRFMSIFIQFISNIILARLLTPDDYGCIGMLAIFMLLSAAIIDGGFSSALIQKKRHRIMRRFKKIDRNPNVCDKVDRLTQCHIKGSFYEQQ
jgi:O-antigen/teichoic acid export membrane protein